MFCELGAIVVIAVGRSRVWKVSLLRSREWNKTSIASRCPPGGFEGCRPVPEPPFHSLVQSLLKCSGPRTPTTVSGAGWRGPRDTGPHGAGQSPSPSEADGVAYVGGTQCLLQTCPGLSDSAALSHTRHIHPSSWGRDAAGLADQTQGDMHTLEVGLGQKRIRQPGLGKTRLLHHERPRCPGKVVSWACPPNPGPVVTSHTSCHQPLSFWRKQGAPPGMHSGPFPGGAEGRWPGGWSGTGKGPQLVGWCCPSPRRARLAGWGRSQEESHGPARGSAPWHPIGGGAPPAWPWRSASSPGPWVLCLDKEGIEVK